MKRDWTRLLVCVVCLLSALVLAQNQPQPKTISDSFSFI